MYKQSKLQLDVVFQIAEEGGFIATVPSLPGCISEGDSLQEARENIMEAIDLYLGDMDESGELDLENIQTAAVIEKASISLK